MTLDLYGHLFESRLDDVADPLDAAARAAGVYPSVTTASCVMEDRLVKSLEASKSGT